MAFFCCSADYETEKSYWIGGSDQKQETIFEWSSGATFSYSSKRLLIYVNENLIRRNSRQEPRLIEDQLEIITK